MFGFIIMVCTLLSPTAVQGFAELYQIHFPTAELHGAVSWTNNSFLTRGEEPAITELDIWTEWKLNFEFSPVYWLKIVSPCSFPILLIMSGDEHLLSFVSPFPFYWAVFINTLCLFFYWVLGLLLMISRKGWEGFCWSGLRWGIPPELCQGLGVGGMQSPDGESLPR